ncbi:ACT domain-containing protein [Nocardioides limicola]|uniref:ACT domain-containing protein n=1 Tax=Nocardioides limicola TaxID=2803368 RepID=UPI00193C266D|nr:ACT domain-containing protein [Nocardioides sp. DJM-14]
MSNYDLTQHAEALAIVRFDAGADLPPWASSGTLLSITATATETSLVCAAAVVPAKAPSIGPLIAFEVAGPLDPTLTGVLAGLLTPLAEVEIPVFPLSTHDTDWILVPEQDAEAAAEEWRRRGHHVHAAPLTSPGASS